MNTPRPQYRVLWLTLYAVAMGILEAAVVIDLRALYYPGGFAFPLVTMPEPMLALEVVRELSTLVMLLAVAVLGGTDRTDRFFVFAYLFGVWDLVYYLGLWLFLGWPPSVSTWDLLFLVPLPWLGPVLYPVLVSLLFILGFTVHRALSTRGRPLAPTAGEWLVATFGALLVVIAFCVNWRVVTAGTIPTSFPLGVFGLGLITGTAPFVRATLRARRGQTRR